MIDMCHNSTELVFSFKQSILHATVDRGFLQIIATVKCTECEEDALC